MSDPLHLDQQLCFALHAASRAMVGAYQPLLAELGVTYPQYLVLLVLWEEGTVRLSRVGERLALDSGTLTPLLKRLESQGLVVRRRSSVDERALDIDLTALGKRLRKRAIGLPRAMVCKAALPVDELVRLRKTLRELTKNLVDRPTEKAS